MIESSPSSALRASILRSTAAAAADPSPTDEENEDLNALQHTSKWLALGVILSSTGIAVLIFLILKSIIQTQLIFALCQSFLGIFLGVCLVRIAGLRNQRLLTITSVTSASLAVCFIVLVVLVIVFDGLREGDEIISMNELTIYVILSVFQIGGTFLTAWFLTRIKQVLSNLLFLSTTIIPTKALLNSKGINSPSIRDSADTQAVVRIDEVRESKTDFFENCSQFSESLVSEIDNSLPNQKKKVGLNSMEELVYGNTIPAVSTAIDVKPKKEHRHHNHNLCLQNYQQQQQQQQYQQQQQPQQQTKQFLVKRKFDSLDDRIYEEEEDSSFDVDGNSSKKSKNEEIDDDDLQFVQNTVKSQQNQLMRDHSIHSGTAAAGDQEQVSDLDIDQFNSARMHRLSSSLAFSTMRENSQRAISGYKQSSIND